ncbi:hypothetical protein J2J97_27970 (plasmid) [Rhizobium bangladeshense]|uniref:DUF7007 domain-containing protein n=1 Tax=Rhizobium bangladeshense TaxID=1138189 RepID=UPI001A9822CA|nr:hypothetical protein [Rhizobium bangladeshense]QSY97958.1 hypothetical protein J2J97_27970 [Rhizobium bangladeshense]
MSVFSSARYGRTRDGWLAARVGQQAFAMLPHEAGYHLAKAWGLNSPIEDWSAADFHDGRNDPVDEHSFREVVEEWDHHRQLKGLDRRSIPPRAVTPWGPSHVAVAYAAGIVSHQTASHGGFALTPDRNAVVPDLLRTVDGYYEEDCAWAAVAIAFPDLFTDLEKRQADEILRHVYPDAWEAHYGTALQAGQSRARDRQRFDAAHADRWVVIAAILSSQHPGYIECIATLGGRRSGHPAQYGEHALVERRFLVAEERYDIGPYGFVIDEEQDEAYDGPSSFAGWADR